MITQKTREALDKFRKECEAYLDLAEQELLDEVYKQLDVVDSVHVNTMRGVSGNISVQKDRL